MRGKNAIATIAEPRDHAWNREPTDMN
jgi:hypothetical protein